MNNNSLGTKPHYPILDGLRGVAALTVVAFHIFEPNSNGHLDQIINHGYLAVDFFFLLSGFVIGYAYDDRWQKLTIGGFFRRRMERLQPMVVMGMLIGAACFYFSDSPAFPLIHTIPVWRMMIVMLIGFTLLPLPMKMDIRGWEEMHPLDGPAWSLFFEYVANFLYGIGLRKLPKWALSLLVFIAAAVLLQYAVTSKTGDVIGGWSLDREELRVGFTRLTYPFFAGLLLSRIAKPTRLSNAFLWSSMLLAITLFMPRLGGSQHLWKNGLYDALIIIFIFPAVVYLGASGKVKGRYETKICKFLGDISYPIYITHYPFIYIYTGWVSKHHEGMLTQKVLFGILTFITAVVVGYTTLKFYDEPVRAWLKKKLA